MSSNRLLYDTQYYQEHINESTGPLGYMLYPMKFEHCNKCRPTFGLVGGNNVSIIHGNMVDLENDLRGQTRTLSNSREKKYKPADTNMITVKGPTSLKERQVDLSLLPLPSCDFFEYHKNALPKPVIVEHPCINKKN